MLGFARFPCAFVSWKQPHKEVSLTGAKSAEKFGYFFYFLLFKNRSRLFFHGLLSSKPFYFSFVPEYH